MKILRITAYFYFSSIIIISIGFIIEGILGVFGWFMLILSAFLIILIINAIDVFKERTSSDPQFKTRFYFDCYVIDGLYIGISIYLYFLNDIYTKFPGILIPLFFLLGSISCITCTTIHIIVLKKLKKFEP